MRFSALPTLVLAATGVFLCFSVQSTATSRGLGQVPGAATDASRSERKPPRRADWAGQPKYRDGELLVRFRAGVSSERIRAIHAAIGARPTKTWESVPGLALVHLPAGTLAKDAIRSYRQNPEVLYAEPNYTVHALGVPNDPLFPQQWNMQNTGQNGGTPGADIHATQAWNLTTGSANVVVAVIDTGVDYTHPDLAANIWTAPSAFTGANQFGAAFSCPAGSRGLDVVDGTCDPMDYNGHGTHVSGIIGAQGNNGVGVAGVNWAVTILPCQFLDVNGTGSVGGAISCLDLLDELKGAGVNIVASNNSWGGGEFSQALHDAVQTQMQDGILFIAAAGNGDDYGNPVNNDAIPTYPASFDLPNVISVAATDRSDDLAGFSNYGRRSVQLGAPGAEILSTYTGLGPGGAYEELSGTSMATPHVTGVAALLAAQDPTRDWRAIRNLLLAGGDPDPALAETVSQKRLNAHGSLTCSNQPLEARLQPRLDFVTTSLNSPVLLRVLNIDCAAPAGGVSVTVEPSGLTIPLLDDGNAPDQAAGDGVYSASWTPAQTGQYTLNFPNGDAVTVDVLAAYNFASAPANYVSITGTNLGLEYDQSATVNLPFPIRFGGQTFSTLYVSYDGIITLDRPFENPVPFPLPYPDAGAILAPLWDDLNPVYPDSDVFWDVAGAAPSREIVIEWRNMYQFPLSPAAGYGTGITITFEAVLHEDRDEVDFNYANMDIGYPSWANYGADASVGIQAGPFQGTQFSVGTPSVQSNTSLVWQPTSPDFSITLDEPTQTVYPGRTAAFTGTVQSLFGMVSPVAVSCAGNAAVTCASVNVAISPANPAAAFSLSAPASAPGSYAFSVQGQTGGAAPLAHQQAAMLDVVDFALGSTSPAGLSVPDGRSASLTLNLSAAGPFNAPVTLACAGLPAGASCSFAPGNPVSLTSASGVAVTVKVSLAANTPVGSYAASVSGTSPVGPGARTANFTLNVTSNPDFLLSASSTALASFAAGTASTSIQAASQDGFAGTVNFSCAVAPAGPSCGVSPAAVTAYPATATLTLNANTAAAGVYQVTLTGTGASATHTLTLSYEIAAYSLTGPATFTAYADANNVIDFTLAPLDGYTGTVQITCDTSAFPKGTICGAGGTVSFTQGPVAANLEIGLSLPYGTGAGPFPLGIHVADVSGQPVVTATVIVTAAGFTFTLESPAEQTIMAGGTTAPFQMLLTPYGGYNLPTTLFPWDWACDPSPCSFTPGNVVTPAGSAIPITLTVGVPDSDTQSYLGDYQFTVQATATPPTPTGIEYPVELFLGNSAQWMTVHVQDFGLSPSNNDLVLVPGSETTFQITNHESNGLNALVSVLCPSTLPPGIGCSMDKTMLADGDVATVTLTAASNAEPSLRNFAFQAVATSSGQTIHHTLNVAAWVSAFSLSIDPGHVSVPAGGDAWYVVLMNDIDLYNAVDIGTVSCTSPDPGILCDAPSVVLAVAGSGFAVNVRTTSGVTAMGSHPFTVSVDAWGETLSIQSTIVMEGSDSIEMSSPDGYELFGSGTQNIIWQYTGNPGPTVKIDLFDKGSFVQTIADSVPVGNYGRGYYAWQMPPNLPFDDQYAVRVTSDSNPAATDISDDPVWMGQGALLYTPSAGLIYYAGGVMFINYTWSGYDHLRFDLYKAGQFVQTVAEATVSGYFDFGHWEWGAAWQIPANFPPGSDYSMKIVPVDAPSLATSSGYFTISQNSITITSPVGGEIWQPGETHAVTWTWVGNPVGLGADVQIGLLGSTSIQITPSTSAGSSGSGSYSWTIPANTPPGNNYRVWISNFQPDNNDFASTSPSPFAIGNYHKLLVTLNGVGWVTSSDTYINCGSGSAQCAALYAGGTSITLTATPSGTSQFTGWSGACAGTGTCTVTMNSDVSVTANFSLPPSLNLSSTPSSATVSAGQTASYAILVATAGMLSNPVHLSCSGLPEATGCSFVPNDFSAGTTAVTSGLAISTTAPSQARIWPASPWQPPLTEGLFFFGLLMTIVLALPWRSRGTRRRFAPALPLLLVLAFLATGCGGGSGGGYGGGSGGGSSNPPPAGPSTPAGTYSVTVTAQSGSATATATVTLIVK